MGLNTITPLRGFATRILVIHYTLCIVHYTLCIVHYTLCIMHYELCIIYMPMRSR